MTQPRFWQRWSVQVLASLSVAILVTIATYFLDLAPTLRRALVVVILAWVTQMVFYIAYSLHSFHVERLEFKHILEVIDSGDVVLLELQSRLREIAARPLSGRPNRVFIDYCHRSLRGTLRVASDAAQRGQLHVRDHHFDTVDKVMDAFDGCVDRTFRCVWLLDDGELFDASWRQYVRCLVDLSQKPRAQHRVDVHVLFVFEDQNDAGNGAAVLRRPAVRNVLAFVAAARGFQGRLIAKSDYDAQLRDANLADEYLDFGVYGDHLLFRTTSYEPSNEGVFSVEATLIARYRRMHDLAMSCPASQALPTDLPTDVTLEAFLDSDRLERSHRATTGRGGRRE